MTRHKIKIFYTQQPHPVLLWPKVAYWNIQYSVELKYDLSNTIYTGPFNLIHSSSLQNVLGIIINTIHLNGFLQTGGQNFQLRYFLMNSFSCKYLSMGVIFLYFYMYACLRFEEVFFWCLTISGPDCPWSELLTVYIISPLAMLTCLRCYEGDWKLKVAHK